jgi:predicted nucleic acid-binding protein
MIILDTNVVSALMLEQPDSVAVSWLDRQSPTSIWTTSITVFEVQFGLDCMPAGRRRAQRETEFENLLRDDLEDRILNFDRRAAEIAAALMAKRRREGRVIDLRDAMIAGIALSQNATLATRNVRHFDDESLKVLNPWAK